MIQRLLAVSASSVCGLVATLLAGSAMALPGGRPPAMVAHRAVYDMALDLDASSDTVTDAEGRMVYDFGGSSCDGYTTRLRLVTRITDDDGNTRLTDVTTTTFEDKLGKTFDFSTKRFVDGAMSEESTGTAERVNDKVEVKVARPKSKRFTIAPSFQFPNQHLEAIVEAALRGDHFMQIELFDGSGNGDQTYQTTVVIGAVNTGADDFGDEAVTREAGVDKVRHWPVTVSYFDEPESGEQSPVYELSFILYENGITRRMRLDYGDFTLTGKLVRLDMAPTKVGTKKCH